VQKLGRDSGEIGVTVVGKVKVRRETLMMVHLCEVTSLPFRVTLAKVTDK
jgi:hypothetical protein